MFQVFVAYFCNLSKRRVLRKIAFDKNPPLCSWSPLAGPDSKVLFPGHAHCSREDNLLWLFSLKPNFSADVVKVFEDLVWSGSCEGWLPLPQLEKKLFQSGNKGDRQTKDEWKIHKVGGIKIAPNCRKFSAYHLLITLKST